MPTATLSSPAHPPPYAATRLMAGFVLCGLRPSVALRLAALQLAMAGVR